MFPYRSFDFYENRYVFPSPERLPFSSRSHCLRGLGLLSLYAESEDVEDLLAERGVIVSRETVRQWANKFGSHFANCIRRDRPRPKDKWHVDEVVITIQDKKHWLWWAIDADGDVLDIPVQPRRNTKPAKRFLKKLIDQFGAPRDIVTDKLRSYIKPIKALAKNADHRAPHYTTLKSGKKRLTVGK